MHKDTISGLVRLKFKKIVMLNAALQNWEMIVDNDLRTIIKELVEVKYDKKMLQKYFKDRKNVWKAKDISKVEVYYWDKENVASRVKLDDSFTDTKIKSITDSGIQQILLKHLNQEKYQNVKDEKGKPLAPEIIAFSADGIDEVNTNIKKLNNGKSHQPIYKIRTYEPKGNKFNVGQVGNKKNKFVEAAKGTNMFFAIYKDAKGKRNYTSVPFNEVLESQKLSAERKEKPQSVPLINENGDKLLFSLSPNDLVFVPVEEEKESLISQKCEYLNPQQLQRVYKVVSFTGNRLYAVQYSVAKSIIDKVEYTQLNKVESTNEKISIKEFCIKLNVDRLGNIKQLMY